MSMAFRLYSFFRMFGQEYGLVKAEHKYLVMSMASSFLEEQFVFAGPLVMCLADHIYSIQVLAHWAQDGLQIYSMLSAETASSRLPWAIQTFQKML